MARSDNLAARARPATGKPRARHETEHHVSTGAGAPSDPLVRAEIWRALDALPEKLRLAMILAGIQGHDIRAIAQLLKVPEGTVKSRLFLARERLRELLKWNR